MTEKLGYTIIIKIVKELHNDCKDKNGPQDEAEKAWH